MGRIWEERLKLIEQARWKQYKCKLFREKC